MILGRACVSLNCWFESDNLFVYSVEFIFKWVRVTSFKCKTNFCLHHNHVIKSKGQTISNYPTGLPEEKDITLSGILWEKKPEEES